MPEPRPLTFLCITTYEKGQEFMRECKRQGCRVILLTAEKLRDADWPRESPRRYFLSSRRNCHRRHCEAR